MALYVVVLVFVGAASHISDLMFVVMATDGMANWYAAYGIQHSDFFARPGLQRLTAFALLVLVTGPSVRTRLRLGVVTS